MQLSNKYKTILCITLYRILQSSTQGIFNSSVQYNQSDAEMKNANQYRKEILQEIVEYIELLENIDDIVLASNLN